MLHVRLVGDPQRFETGVRRYAEGLTTALRKQIDITVTTGDLWKQEWRGRGGEVTLAAGRYLRPAEGFTHALDPCVVQVGTDVVTVHDCLPESHPEWFGWGERMMRKALILPLVRRAKLLMPNSECTRQDLIRAWGVKADRVVTVPHAIMPAPLPPRDLAPRDPGLFVYVGSDHERKNLRLVARALDLLPSNIRFVRAGPRLYGNRRHGRFLEPGRVSDEHAHALMRSCAAFIWPAQWEGFGLPPLEALACGSDVLALDTRINREVLQDHATYYQDTPESLANVMLNARERVMHEKRGDMMRRVRYARSFSFERTAQMTRAAYETVQPR